MFLLPLPRCLSQPFFSIDCRDALSIYCYQMLNDIIYRRYSTWFRYLFAKSVSG